MKFSKLFTKIVAGTAMGIMLMSTAAMASNITATYDIPGYSYVTSYGITGVRPLVTPSNEAYAAMVVQANKVYPNYGAMVVDKFTHVCISADTLDKAIAAAKSAADKVLALNTVDMTYWNGGVGTVVYDSNVLLSKVASYNFVANTVEWPHVKLTAYDRSIISDINSLLRTASVGGVDLNFKTTVDNDEYVVAPGQWSTNDDFVKKVFLQAGHDLINVSMNDVVILNKTNSSAGTTGHSGYSATFNRPDTVNDVSDALTAYAKLLTTLKTFYSTACNIVPTPTTTTDNDVTEAPVKTTKNAVINAKDKNIKLNSNFNLKAANVTATDNNGKGKDLTSKITQTGKVDTSKKGTFKVTYYVTGANGKKVSKTVTYTVK